MSEQGAALVMVIAICIVCGPFYLAFLVFGFIRRKQLIPGLIAKSIYAASFPLAIVATSLVSVFGSEEINTPSNAGQTLYNLAFACLGIGALAAIYIIVASLRATRNAKHVKDSR